MHRLRNFGLAMGWDHQLKTEPTLTVILQRTWRYGCGHADGFAAEFLPHAGASVGNTVTFACLGGQLRAGYRLPRDFGTATIDSITPGSGGRPADAHRGFYLFTEVEGRALAYNAFLDGGRRALAGARHREIGDRLGEEDRPVLPDARSGHVIG